MGSDFSIEVFVNTKEEVGAAIRSFWLAVCGVLATLAILSAWFHGSIFRPLRARVNAMDNWIGRLLSCPFCLTFHVVAVVFLVGQSGKIGRGAVQWLAIVAVVHWLWWRFWSRLFDR